MNVPVNVTLALVGMSVASCFITAVNARAEISDGAPAIDTLFDRAVTAKGDEYRRLREAMLQQGAEGHVLIEGRKDDPNLHVRIVARALSEWLNEPEKNKRRESLLLEAVAWQSMMRPGITARAIGGVAESGWRPGDNELHEQAALPFLLEAALKGGPLVPWGLKHGGRANLSFWAQCLAVGLMGHFENDDVLLLLKHSLEDERFEIRVCAAVGLRMSMKRDAVEPLIERLRDPSPEVRLVSYLGLREMTRQDFRDDTSSIFVREVDAAMEVRFRDWWEQNKETWTPPPKNPKGRQF